MRIKQIKINNMEIMNNTINNFSVQFLINYIYKNICFLS